MTVARNLLIPAFWANAPKSAEEISVSLNGGETIYRMKTHVQEVLDGMAKRESFHGGECRAAREACEKNPIKFFESCIYEAEACAGAPPQLNSLVHEVGHLHGLGVGEYYSLGTMNYNTGMLPDLDVSTFQPSSQDPFWSSRSDVQFQDPMTNRITKPRLFLERNEFGVLSSALINQTARYNISGDSSLFYAIYRMPRDQEVVVRVSDRQTGERLQGCDVFAFNARGRTNSVEPNELMASGSTALDGGFTFPWGLPHQTPHSVANVARLVKASCPGYEPGGDWVSKFDLQAFLYADGGQIGDFHYSGAMSIQLDRSAP